MTAKPLRPYQFTLSQDVRAAWEYGARNVLMRLDTGGGKTVILSDLIAAHLGAAALIAHRQELVVQLSMALAELGIRHNLIAAKKTIQNCVRKHMKAYGRSFYDPGNRVAVASVDTLVRAKGLDAWFAQVTLWIVDEGHHVVEDNKWHTVLMRFTHPLCRGLLPTATPSRADGVGLGRGHGGVADVMVEGPPMRWLIEQGYLTDYRMVCIKSDVVDLLEGAKVGGSGDYSQATLKDTAQRSHIVGDVVRLYKQWAGGKTAIVFAPDVDTAANMVRQYQAAGVKAGLLIGDMDPGLRDQNVEQLTDGRLDLCVAVDVVSEGFDLPAIIAAIFGRKTDSLATYMQQFGRALRPLYAKGSGYGPGHLYDLNTQTGRLAAIAAGPKPRAIIIDCVNNYAHHGPPDRLRPWTLEGVKRMVSDAIPTTNCLNVRGWVACTPEEKARVTREDAWVPYVEQPDGTLAVEECAQPYERFYPFCPYCGHKEDKEPALRATPAMVDGDLAELSDEAMALLRGAYDAENQHPSDYARTQAATGLDQFKLARNVQHFEKRQNARAGLRAAMELWGGVQRVAGRSDAEMQRLFYLQFGVDVMTAQTLKPDQSAALAEKVDGAVNSMALVNL